MLHVTTCRPRAAAAVFVAGLLWYSPLLFFKPWMRLRGMDPVAAMAVRRCPREAPHRVWCGASSWRT